MKPLADFLTESIEIEKNSKGYRTVTVLRRDNVDVANLTKEEFVRMMREDLEKAQEEYSKLVAPQKERQRLRYIEELTQRAQEYAMRKWKTEKKRQEYMVSAKAQIEQDAARYSGIGRDEMYWDFKPHVDNGIPGVCILKVSTGDNQLERCYEEWLTSKWWKKGTGWAFKYECTEHSFISCFRPWIDLLMDESSTAERKREQQNLDQAIADWYASIPSGGYCGD